MSQILLGSGYASGTPKKGYMMSEPQVIIVFLRRPRLDDDNEMRPDPFWEFGSFGCTGCHRRNLMNLNKPHLLEGARLAFAQGGDEGVKLVHLTPPIHVVNHGHVREAKWEPANMPFRYGAAPLLISNSGSTDFPQLRGFIERTHCRTWVSKFSSRFRSRCKPLDRHMAQEVIDVFERETAAASPGAFASTYVDALPYPPPKIDRNREQTYKYLLGIR
jgi:hypothetical protein